MSPQEGILVFSSFDKRDLGNEFHVISMAVINEVFKIFLSLIVYSAAIDSWFV